MYIIGRRRAACHPLGIRRSDGEAFAQFDVGN